MWSGLSPLPPDPVLLLEPFESLALFRSKFGRNFPLGVIQKVMKLRLKLAPQALQLALRLQQNRVHFFSLLGIETQPRGQPVFNALPHEIRISHRVQNKMT